VHFLIFLHGVNFELRADRRNNVARCDHFSVARTRARAAFYSMQNSRCIFRNCCLEVLALPCQPSFLLLMLLRGINNAMVDLVLLRLVSAVAIVQISAPSQLVGVHISPSGVGKFQSQLFLIHASSRIHFLNKCALKLEYAMKSSRSGHPYVIW
jgi:hypothetical protein